MAALVVAPQLREPRFKGRFVITYRLVDPVPESGYPEIEFFGGLPGSRLGAIELCVHALAQARDLRLKLRLAVNTGVRGERRQDDLFLPVVNRSLLPMEPGPCRRRLSAARLVLQRALRRR